MNRFRKIITMLLLSIVVLGGNAVTVNAQSEDSEGFFVCSDEVPEEVYDFARGNVYKVLVGYGEHFEMDINNISVGQPFTIVKEQTEDIDVFYFPIFEKQDIILTYRVYFDMIANEYVGIMGEYLAEQLNSYKQSTSRSLPLTIYMDNGNVCAMNGTDMRVLWQEPYGLQPQNNALRRRSVLNVINIAEPLEYTITIMPRASASDLCELDMIETQGQQQWCAAFVASSILRYKGADSSVTAETMIKWANPNISDTDLPNASISRADIVTYAHNLGFSKTVESSSTISSSTVVSEIGTNDSPIYAGCYGTGNYSKARHALVIAGYNNNTSQYTVWNPWGTTYETMPYGTKTYVVNSSSSFVWDVTIYKFR